MAILHAFSNAQPNATGTVTYWGGATTATVAATDVVRPTDWNSAHTIVQNLSGNTAGTSQISGSDVVWAGGNNVTLSANGSTVSINAANQSVQPVAFSAPGGSSAFSTLTFANSNGVSFSNSNGSVVATVVTAYAASNHSHGNPTLNLTNLSGTTASNSAGLTLSLSAGAIPTVTQYFSATNTTFNGTNVSGSMTLNTAGLRIDLSAGAGGGGNVVASASNGSFSFTTLAFSNANNVTFGTSAGSIITASVAPPGAAAESNAINLLGANTAGNTTVTGSTIGMSGINLTLSGTNVSQLVFSAPATSSLVGVDGISLSSNGSTVSIRYAPDLRNYYNPQDGYVQVAGQQGNASMHIQPAYIPAVTFDRIAMPVVVTNATNSTGTVSLSVGMIFYTRNGSTFSSVSSTSGSQAVTFSGTVNNSTFAGMRLMTIGFSGSLPENQYYVGIWSRTSSGGANATINQFLASQVNSVFSGILGVASNASVQYTRGLGIYSATFSTALPATVGISQLQGSASIVIRQPVFYLVNGTF